MGSDGKTTEFAISPPGQELRPDGSCLRGCLVLGSIFVVSVYSCHVSRGCCVKPRELDYYHWHKSGDDTVVLVGAWDPPGGSVLNHALESGRIFRVLIPISDTWPAQVVIESEDGPTVVRETVAFEAPPLPATISMSSSASTSPRASA